MSVGYIPLEIPGQSLETCSGVGQVLVLPDDTGISTTCSNRGVRIVTVIITSQAIVEAITFNNDFQGRIIRPFKAKEPGQEILPTLQHAVLSSCTGNDLCARVVEMAVLIVVQDTRIKEPGKWSILDISTQQDSAYSCRPTGTNISFLGRLARMQQTLAEQPYPN